VSTAQFTPAQALSIWPGQPVERAQGAALRVPDGIHGMVLYGPGLSVAPGVYRVHARAQAEGSHDASPLFDVSAETRIFASRLSHEGWEVFVHLYATEALEFRFQARGGGFTIEGVELEPLLLDADPSDAATVRALLDRLTEGWGEADARFRLIDRLAAFGLVDEAEQYRARYVGGQGRVGAKIRVAFADLNTPGGLPSGYEPFEASWKQIEALLDHYPLHEVDLLRLGPAERADLLSRGYQPDFLYATWRHRDYAEPPRVWREHADPTLNAAEFTSRPPLFERRVDIDRSHQASLAREEGMVAYCPVSGRELRSRHGFLQHFYGLPFVFYRFEGVEVFYVCTGHVSSAKSFVYIPRTGTVVHIGDTWLRSKPPAGVIRRFNVNLVHFRDKVRQYLGRPSTPAAVVGSDNLGHYFWTNFSGLQYASENGLLDKVAEVIELSRTFASPALAFEELADKPRHAFDIDVLAFEHCLDRGLLPIHFTDLIITDALGRSHRADGGAACVPGRSPAGGRGPTADLAEHPGAQQGLARPGRGLRAHPQRHLRRVRRRLGLPRRNARLRGDRGRHPRADPAGGADLRGLPPERGRQHPLGLRHRRLHLHHQLEHGHDQLAGQQAWRRPRRAQPHGPDELVGSGAPHGPPPLDPCAGSDHRCGLRALLRLPRALEGALRPAAAGAGGHLSAAAPAQPAAAVVQGLTPRRAVESFA
jgi:hypothetical protein